ncbi:hypothetical protein PDIDSM_733 [Penicillium digitatum]|nr:hypothetical protein PDIDSM_733 [Penicillium digitatum]
MPTAEYRAGTSDDHPQRERWVELLQHPEKVIPDKGSIRPEKDEPLHTEVDFPGSFHHGQELESIEFPPCHAVDTALPAL